MQGVGQQVGMQKISVFFQTLSSELLFCIVFKHGGLYKIKAQL